MDVTVPRTDRVAAPRHQRPPARRAADEERATSSTRAYRSRRSARTVLDLRRDATAAVVERALDRPRARLSTPSSCAHARRPSPAAADSAAPAVLDERRRGRRSRAASWRRRSSALRRDGVPRPRVDRCVCGFESTSTGRDGGLVVEVDGFAFHRTRRPLQRDRTRARSPLRSASATCRSRPPGRPAPGRGRRRSAAVRALDQLDPVAVRVAHEAEPRAALAHLVGRLLGLDALLGERARASPSMSSTVSAMWL